MNHLDKHFFPEIEFLHENFLLYHFPYINNKLEYSYLNEYMLSIYGLKDNLEKFTKIFNEISYCNKKNIKISTNVFSHMDSTFISFKDCFADSLDTDLLGTGMHLAMKFQLMKPNFYLAGALVD